jgi:hypothetical protein
MHHLTELSFNHEFRWFSPFHYAVLHRCVLQAGRPSLPYYCAVALHSCIILPPVSHSPHHKYHPCQLTRQSSCVSNFYSTFKVFIWLYLVYYWTCVCTHTHIYSYKLFSPYSPVVGMITTRLRFQALHCMHLHHHAPMPNTMVVWPHSIYWSVCVITDCILTVPYNMNLSI